MTSRPPSFVSRIDRTNLVLGAAVTAVCGLLWGLSGMLAAGLGTVLGALNFWALHRLGRGIVKHALAGEVTGRVAGLVLLLFLKMGLLFGCVWLAVVRGGLPILPFTLGISVFVVSVLGASLVRAPLAPAEEAYHG